MFGEQRLEKRNERTFKLLNIDVESQSSTVRDYPFDLASEESMEMFNIRNIMMWTRFNILTDRQPALDREKGNLEEKMKDKSEKDNQDYMRKAKLD